MTHPPEEESWNDEGIPFSELIPQEQARWQKHWKIRSVQSSVTETGEEIPSSLDDEGGTRWMSTPGTAAGATASWPAGRIARAWSEADLASS
jgi:hypothetical protein